MTVDNSARSSSLTERASATVPASASTVSEMVGRHSASTTLEGIDISDYQGSVNMRAVRQSGRHFVIPKATEGTYGSQVTFEANWAHAREVGLERIAYHYFRPSENGSDQADFLHSFVREHGRFRPGEGVMLDLEVSDGLEPQQVIANAEAFVKRAWDKIGKAVFIYTYPDFWINTLLNPVSTVLGKCPLVVADYGPYVPHFTNWPNGLSIWQYSETGAVPGVPAHCDLDRFYGNKAALTRILRSTVR